MNTPAHHVALWRHKIVRWTVWLTVSLVTLYLLIVAWTNFTGARGWNTAQAMLQREGESLNFKALIPIAPPDETNFCAIEPLLGIATPGKEGATEKKRQALMQSGFGVTKGRPPGFGDGPALGNPVNVAAWAAFFAENGWITASATSEMNAEKLLAVLNESRPLLKTLSDSARSYQRAAFTPPLEERIHDGNIFQLELPHYQCTQAVSKSLALRSILAARSGNVSDSIGSALALAHLTEALSEEPLLIGLLVSVTTHSQLAQAVWEILAVRALTAEQLSALQNALARLDFEKASLLAMRGEMAAAISTLQFAEKNPAQSLELLTAVSDGGMSLSRPSPISKALALLINRGFFDHNKTTLVDLEFGGIIRPLRDGGLPAAMHASADMEQKCRELLSPLKPGSMFAAMTAPSVVRVFQKVIHAEAIHQQSVIACALERHFIHAKDYPQTLDVLVPALLPTVPPDPCDGKPMRYTRTEEGRYRLWSIGLDGKDDHGTVNAEKSGELSQSAYQGDWSWCKAR